MNQRIWFWRAGRVEEENGNLQMADALHMNDAITIFLEWFSIGSGIQRSFEVHLDVAWRKLAYCSACDWATVSLCVYMYVCERTGPLWTIKDSELGRWGRGKVYAVHDDYGNILSLGKALNETFSKENTLVVLCLRQVWRTFGAPDFVELQMQSAQQTRDGGSFSLVTSRGPKGPWSMISKLTLPPSKSHTIKRWFAIVGTLLRWTNGKVIKTLYFYKLQRTRYFSRWNILSYRPNKAVFFWLGSLDVVRLQLQSSLMIG